MFSSLINLMEPLPTKSIGKRLTPIDTFMPILTITQPKNMSFLKLLVTRAIQIFSPQFLEKEKSHLTKALVANGYSITQINKAFTHPPF
jgi:hypothetical protein